MFGLEAGALSSWVVYIIGGIIGIAFVSFLFDWAIITLSSSAGALLIIRTFFPQSGNVQLIFIALIILGVVVQGSLLRSEKRPGEQD